jgi:hypothetical protein
MREMGVRDVLAVRGSVSLVARNALDVIGDAGRVVQELHHHMPRIVENQQSLGPIVRQLALRSLRLGSACERVLSIWTLEPRAGTAPVFSNWGRWTLECTLTVRIGSLGTQPSNFKNQGRDSCPEAHCPDVQCGVTFLRLRR